MVDAGASRARLEFDERGYVIARGLFSVEEVESIRRYFRDMVERGGDGWAEGSVDPNDPDPLKRYPRLLQPHRGDDVAMRFMVDPRINQWLTDLLGREPLAVQTMVYFKPPGARGQALHQDQRYLKVDPGTCVAAWMALDKCDEENGCLELVPGSHRLEMLCPIPSDTTQSFTREMVPVPPGMHTEMAPLDPGDVIFFNGSVIHGSPPNDSPDRFRTIIVGHYIVGEARAVAKYYFPVYRMDGSVVEGIAISPAGQPCGTFVEKGDRFEFEFSGEIEGAKAAH